MVLKKSNKRQLKRKKTRTNTKRRKLVQKGGVYPNGAVKDDGTPFGREEYIELLKTHIGLTDETILAIEGHPTYSRDGIDHSVEFTGQKLLEFKTAIGKRLAEAIGILQSIIFVTGADGEYIRDAQGIAQCKPFDTLTLEQRRVYDEKKYLCLGAIKHLQRYIIEHTPHRPNGRVATMTYNYLDICKTLSVDFSILPEELQNEINTEYMNLFFSEVARHPLLHSFFITCINGPIDPNHGADVANDLRDA
jgi:hypothetical protein